MDQSHRSSQLAGEGRISAGQCRSCAISLWVAGKGTCGVDACVIEDVNENVLVVSGPEFEGLVVIPRIHIGVLEELSIVHRAQVLAALQRANRMVQERNPGKTTTVVAMTDPPASEGHTCYQVLPSGEVDPGQSPVDTSVSAVDPVAARRRARTTRTTSTCAAADQQIDNGWPTVRQRPGQTIVLLPLSTVVTHRLTRREGCRYHRRAGRCNERCTELVCHRDG